MLVLYHSLSDDTLSGYTLHDRRFLGKSIVIELYKAHLPIMGENSEFIFPIVRLAKQIEKEETSKNKLYKVELNILSKSIEMSISEHMVLKDKNKLDRDITISYSIN